MEMYNNFVHGGSHTE